MGKAPPTRDSLHGSHRLQLDPARHDARRIIAAEDPAGNDGGNLRGGCNEFRGPRGFRGLATVAFGLIAAGARNDSMDIQFVSYGLS